MVSTANAVLILRWHSQRQSGGPVLYDLIRAISAPWRATSGIPVSRCTCFAKLDVVTEPHSVTPSRETLYTLSIDVIKAAIRSLQGQRIHEHFPGYLHLRQRAMRARSLTAIDSDWNEVSELLRVDGGPSNKPHYRPFTARNLRDPSGYWYQRNLPGSYAPRSIRNTASFMLDATRSGYELPPDHAQQALALMLKGTKVSAWALAAFYLRDYGFTLDPPGGHDDLIDAFKEKYLFNQGNDFAVLFDTTEPIFIDPWFEQYVAAAENLSSNRDQEDGSDA